MRYKIEVVIQNKFEVLDEGIHYRETRVGVSEFVRTCLSSEYINDPDFELNMKITLDEGR